jgi:glutamate--cysteine ligase
MSAPAQSSNEPVTGKAQLVEYIAAGCKPKSDWRIGTEHEKFVFHTDGFRPVPYEGDSGIVAIFRDLEHFGWKPISESGKVIALNRNGASITLEPGGQFELSGAPLVSVHDTCREVDDHLTQVKRIGSQLGISFLGLGFNPKWARADIPWMPKDRYAIMRRYMPTKGQLGLDMMLRSCTVQVNLDFGSEADMVKKFRVGLALQPLATALWANSPFVEGKPSGFLSFRSHVWTDTDPDRCGMLPMVFEDGMSFERYVDWALDVPMYFVYRDGRYVDASGQSFKDFMNGRLPALPGEVPTLGDWVDHLTTLFPEVRLKRFLEMRGADAGPWRKLCALPAFWTGLYYDQIALDSAWDLVRDWSAEERQQLRADVPTLALSAEIQGRKLRDVAIEVLAISRDGLKRRAKHDFLGRDESIFLNTIEDIAGSGITAAESMLAAYGGAWKGSVDPAYRDYSY